MQKEIKNQLSQSFVTIKNKNYRDDRFKIDFEGSFLEFIKKENIKVSKVRNKSYHYRISYKYGSLSASIETMEINLLTTLLSLMLLNANYIGGQWTFNTWGYIGRYTRKIVY